MHIVASVAWLGAVVVFLALSIIGITSHAAEVVRSAYVSMNAIGLFVIIPMSLGSLATGVLESLSTPWGLFKHYWVVAKLLLTVIATGLLLIHQFEVVSVAATRVNGAANTLPSARRLGIQLIVEASLAVIALLTATALAVYKPKGSTELKSVNSATGLRILIGIIAAIAVVFVVMHATGLAGRHH